MELGLLVELRPNKATLRLVIEVETACAMVTSFVMGEARSVKSMPSFKNDHLSGNGLAGWQRSFDHVRVASPYET
jgi:hypothetical protein